MVNILFAGDICFAELTDKNQKKLDEKCFGDIHGHIRNADISIANLECPLTNSINKQKKIGPNLKAFPSCAKVLKPFDIISLANNHMMDFGEEGLGDTIKYLEKNNLKITGVNRSVKYANYDELIIKKGSNKFAFLAFSEGENASPNFEGVGVCLIDPIDIYRKISDLKNKADYIFITLHGGYEHFPLPFPEFTKLCHFLVDIGADAVVCHHIHVPGPYEIYKGKPIVYSTGNFYFPSETKAASWNEGYLALINVDTDHKNISLDLLPYRFDQRLKKLKKLKLDEKNNFMQNINYLNKIIKNEKLLDKYINEQIKKRMGATLAYLFFWFRIPGLARILKIRKLSFLLLNKYDVRLKENLISTFSHRNLIIKSLKLFLSEK